MTRRFEVGPILVALGAVVLLVSLFLDWYGSLTAWDAFEVVEVPLPAGYEGDVVVRASAYNALRQRSDPLETTT